MDLVFVIIIGNKKHPIVVKEVTINKDTTSNEFVGFPSKYLNILFNCKLKFRGRILLYSIINSYVFSKENEIKNGRVATK